MLIKFLVSLPGIPLALLPFRDSPFINVRGSLHNPLVPLVTFKFVAPFLTQYYAMIRNELLIMAHGHTAAL